MSINELNKVEVIGKVAQKSLTQHQAADILNITSRQIRRLLKKYQENGASALISKKRERPSNHQLPSYTKELALALIKAHYHDFGPTLAHEKLTEVHKIDISLWSVRNIMIANNLWIDKKIKKQRVHQPCRYPHLQSKYFTIASILNNLETFDTGSFTLDGFSLNLTEANRSHTVGMVFQHFNLFEHLHVEDNIILTLMKCKGINKIEAELIANTILRRLLFLLKNLTQLILNGLVK